MLIPHALANLSPGIHQRPLLHRKDQRLRLMLPDIILPVPVKHILIMPYPDHNRLRKMRDYLLRLLPVTFIQKYLFLHIDV